jgi:hypothetical protein
MCVFARSLAGRAVGNHFELVIPMRLVPIEVVNGDIHLPIPRVGVDELMRTAATMRVEIKDEHRLVGLRRAHGRPGNRCTYGHPDKGRPFGERRDAEMWCRSVPLFSGRLRTVARIAMALCRLLSPGFR